MRAAARQALRSGNAYARTHRPVSRVLCGRAVALFTRTLLCALCLPIHAQSDSLPTYDRGAPPHYLLGAGGLTAAVGEYGELRALRWPGPASLNHVRPAPTGSNWILLRDGAVLRPEVVSGRQGDTAHGTGFIETVLEYPGGTRIVQRGFVWPAHDVLVLHVEFEGGHENDDLVFLGPFSPIASPGGTWPDMLRRYPSRAGFAAFVDEDSQSIYHFRPSRLLEHHWRQADELGGSWTVRDWDRFEPGVWVGYTMLDGHTWASVLDGRDVQILEGAWQNLDGEFARSAAGNFTISLATPRLVANAAAKSATLMLAAGGTRAEVEARLEQGRETGLERMRSDTTAWWRVRIEGFEGLDALSEDGELASAALVTILSLQDRQSGAIARSALDDWTALDWPRFTAWAGAALREAGGLAEAGAHLAFLSAQVNPTSSRTRPQGLLAAAHYGDGTDGSKPFVVDIDGLAAYVNAYAGYYDALDSAGRADLVENQWPLAEAAAQLLVTWRDAFTRLPLPSFDPVHGRDALNVERLPAYHAGLARIITVALDLRLDRPEWVRRRTEYEALIQRHCLDRDGLWNLDPAQLPFESLFPQPDTMFMWVPAAFAAERIGESEGLERLQLAAVAAVLGRERDRAIALDAIRTESTTAHPIHDYDAWAAALVLHTLLTAAEIGDR